MNYEYGFTLADLQNEKQKWKGSFTCWQHMIIECKCGIEKNAKVIN